MTYQRVLVKQSAKRAMKGAKPIHRALCYFLLSLLLSLVAALPFLGIRFFAAPTEAGVNNAPAYWSCWLFALVLPTVAQALLYAGGCAYCLDLWRGRGVNSRRLLYGFTRFPRVSALGLLISLFSFLWALLGALLFTPVLFLLAKLLPEELLAAAASPSPGTPLTAGALVIYILVLLIFVLPLEAFCLNCTLRYALSYFVLLDQPQLTAAECLNESKLLMKGRRWQLAVLCFSFLGWSLLEGLLISCVRLLWPVLLSLFPAAALPGAAFWCLRILLILYLAAMVIAALLLPLWLVNYAGVSLAGFYDYAQADRSNQPTPPRSWQVYS